MHRCTPGRFFNAGSLVEPAPQFDAAIRITGDGEWPAIGPFLSLLTNFKALGWKENVDISSFPYDWRYGPEKWTQTGSEFDRLKSAIENLSRRNGGGPVVVVTVSLGAPLLTLFLRTWVSAAWRREFVARHVSMSGVYGGSTLLLGMALGADANLLPAPLDGYRVGIGRTARTFSSILWLATGAPSLPFWNSSIVAETPGRKYRPSELGAFLRNVTFVEGPSATFLARVVDGYVGNPGRYDALAMEPDYDVDCLFGYDVLSWNPGGDNFKLLP